MMDGKTIRDKLVGSDDERAVSPVIGVILMVAITVILAAVIATLVMDFGDSTESPINAQTTSDVSSSNDEVKITIQETGSAEYFMLGGQAGDLSNVSFSDGNADKFAENPSTGDIITVTFDAPADEKEVNVIAVEGQQEETAGSFTVGN
ncbi:archaeal flagellin-like protein [Halovivax ruber XH-70]|uniref:Archaeal flagellin-like protein n=1 Tax=Halovivax ruber (strain DSM 18193 / JCM 13892 / XH-70) TaxID=797302 RepID=L0ICS3_HALRX|nr:type IV pilin N-terminal domain-containing protein [Halovivax ruber]AGB16633.1 archaeal flagellin-like protein [Halovivax ruber XH-70]